MMIETKTIEEVTETLIDYRGKTPEKTKSGVVLITAKVIKDGRILDENHEYVSEANYDSWMRRGLPKLGDILITTEAPLGEVAQLKKTKKVALAQRVILLRGNPKIIYQDYYFHALKLARLVRRVDAGEPIGDSLDFEEASQTNKDDASAEKIEALTELICRAGEARNQIRRLARAHGDS